MPTAKANAIAIIRYPAKEASTVYILYVPSTRNSPFLVRLDEVGLIGFQARSFSTGIAPSAYHQELSDYFVVFRRVIK